MERISSYETSDGRIFKDRGVAQKHQRWLDLLGAIRVLADGATVEELARAIAHPDTAKAVARLVRLGAVEAPEERGGAS